MEPCRLTHSENIQGATICRKGHGDCVLGLSWNCHAEFLGAWKKLSVGSIMLMSWRFRDELKARRRGKLSKGILLLQDNAPAHTSHVAVAAAARYGFQLLPHPLYSPDLAPSDFFLFQSMKESLRGRHFGSNEDVVATVDGFLEEKDDRGFLQKWFNEAGALLEEVH